MEAGNIANPLALDTADYNRWLIGSQLGLTGWENGDFNYDGVVNGEDLLFMENNGYVVAPEPSTLAPLGVGAYCSDWLPLAKRRREVCTQLACAVSVAEWTRKLRSWVFERRPMLDKFSMRSGCRAARLSAVALASIVAASVMLTDAPLHAANYTWAVSAGDWSVASNWWGAVAQTGRAHRLYRERRDGKRNYHRRQFVERFRSETAQEVDRYK